ncbi:MAG: hypothetical protein KY476_05345, partial [Planctomycetes bacterium]|nr:hypothetical protein [Planctomycetota bacterium]
DRVKHNCMHICFLGVGQLVRAEKAKSAACSEIFSKQRRIRSGPRIDHEAAGPEAPKPASMIVRYAVTDR